MQALPMQALPQTIHLEMDEQKTKQLKAMLGICQRLGAETRYAAQVLDRGVLPLFP